MFNEKIGAIKNVAKVCGQITAQMACGGALAAILPANIGIPLKVAYFIGGGLIAMAAGKPIDRVIDESIDDIVETCKETKRNIDILLEKDKEQ